MTKAKGKKRLLAICILLLAVGGLALPVLIARWMLTYTPPCSEPCRDIKWTQKAGTEDTVYEPSCQPLELDLELANRKVRAGESYALWYRATLRNRSCCSIRLNGLTFASIDLRSSFAHDLEIRITNEKGLPVPLFPSHRTKGVLFAPTVRQHDREDIIPYADRPGDFRRIMDEFEMDSDLWFEFKPGARITTSGSDWWPHTRELREYIGKTHQIGISRTPALKAGPRPPQYPGFRAVGHFLVPGKYSVQAVYKHEYARTRPITPYERKVPRLVFRMMNFLDALGIDVYPPTSDERRFVALAESPKLEIEVVSK